MAQAGSASCVNGREFLTKLYVNQGVGFGSKVGQIDCKWDKSGTFSDQISVHFGSMSQNVLKSNLKKS